MVSTRPFDIARTDAASIAGRTGVDHHDVAVVLGSGWGPALDALGDLTADIPMAELAGFPPPTVAGHSGLVGSLDAGGRRVLALRGRAHLYEGHEPAVVVHGVRAAIAAGCRVVILTNAAGSLREDRPVGGPVLIADHLNLTACSPMSGEDPPAGYAPRFVDLTDVYSARLRALAREVDPRLPEGVYAGLPGPHYETPAEIRMLRTMGADLVGMSTVLEAIASRHLGAEVLGVSLVTNLAAGLAPADLDHLEVLEAGRAAAGPLGRFLRAVIDRL